MCILRFSVVSDFLVTPWTVACKAPLFMGFPRQEYWSGLPFPPSGDLPDPGIESSSPASAGIFFLPLSHQGSPIVMILGFKYLLKNSRHLDIYFLPWVRDWVGYTIAISQLIGVHWDWTPASDDLWKPKADAELHWRKPWFFITASP